MNGKTLLGLFRLYLLKKQKLNREITQICLEYERLRLKHRQTLILRNKLVTLLLLLSDDRLHVSRRLTWSYRKNDTWWKQIVPEMPENIFKNNFRIKRSTFMELVDQIGPYLYKNDTSLRQAIPVHKRIACALYLLGSTCELRTVGNLFGIGKSTAAQILHEFCHILVDKFFHRFIKFPTTDDEIKDTTNEFLMKSGYPMCVGCLDGTHISIQPPFGEECDYYNYKKHHSIIMLAVVNSSLQFTYVNIGAPGRCNDSSVFTRSNLYEVMQNQIYANHYTMMNNVKLQAHLIADSAFPLSATLLKPYADRPQMPKKYALFNYRLSRCRCAVERAFGSLKNRFRCLHKKMEFSLHHISNIIKATTILHNMCITSGDDVETEWDITQPVYKKPACNIQTINGTDVREALTEFFVNNPL